MEENRKHAKRGGSPRSTRVSQADRRSPKSGRRITIRTTLRQAKRQRSRLQRIDAGTEPDALSGGVARTHVVDGRILHAVLLEIFSDDAGVGTLLVP